jgi:hypothetical protein
MTTPRCAGLFVIALSIVLSSGVAFTQEKKEDPASGLKTMLQWTGKAGMPNLEGLIKPEKMGALTDNQMNVTDNMPQLLANNEVEPFSENRAPTANNNAAMSGNRAELFSRINLLSNLKFLSDIEIELEINIEKSGNKGVDAKAKKGKGRKKKVGRAGAKKAKKR